MSKGFNLFRILTPSIALTKSLTRNLNNPLLRPLFTNSSNHLTPIKNLPKSIINVNQNGLNSRHQASISSQFLQIRSFRSTPSLKAIPPVILLLASKGGKYLAVVFGRYFRNWYKNLPPEEKALYVAKAKRNRRFIYGILGALGGAAFYHYITHIYEAPITERKRFLMFNDEQMDEISQHQLDILVEEHKDKILPKSDPRHKKVFNVAHKLLTSNKDILEKYGKDKNWTISVVEEKIANAFVLSCGSIFVFTGLLFICEDDEGDAASRLAIILGHELSHVLLSHSAEQASFLHLLDLFLILPVLALWALIPSDATTIFSQWAVGKLTDLIIALPFGRSLEAEADRVGLILSARACFDIREIIIWKKMQLINKNSDAQLELLSTHPSEESRFESLQQQLDSALAVRQDCNCPKLPYFDMVKRVESLESKLKTNRDDILVPIKIDLTKGK